MRGMATIEEIRRTNLAKLRDEAGGVRKLADAVGVSEAQMSQWLNGSADSKSGKPRGMRSDSVRRIETAMKKAEGWLDAPEAVISLVAQPVSQAVHTLPTQRTWEELMDRGVLPQWPEEVTVVVPDRALEPHVMRGDHLAFEACSEAEPTSVVVIETEDGKRWIRRLVRRADGSLWGTATSDAFPEFKATKILARAVRRTSQFNGF